MNWIHDERWRLYLDNSNFVWQIHDSSSRMDSPSGKFAACRDIVPDNRDDLDTGYLDKDLNIVCGSAMFCACGLPKHAIFDTLEEAQKICELDAERLIC